MPIPSLLPLLLNPRIPFVYPPGAIYQTLDFVGYGASALTLSTNAALAPAYTQTAATLIETGATSDHSLGTGIASMGTGAKTLTFFVKSVGSRSVRLNFYNFDFTTYVTLMVSPMGVIDGGNTFITGAGFTGLATTITPSPNGWYKVVATFTVASASVMNPYFYLWNGAATSYAGDSASGVQLWGLDIR